MNRRSFLRNLIGTVAAVAVPLPAIIPQPPCIAAPAIAKLREIDIIELLTRAMLEEIQREEDLAWIQAVEAMIPHMAEADETEETDEQLEPVAA